jgi:hypothetical protein
MGGKGSASNVMHQDYGQYGSTDPGKGGFIYTATGTTTPPKDETKKKEEPAKGTPITEDPSKAGAETVKPDAQIQPYAPPGWGNYPTTNTNLSPLGDVMVSGMQATPGKPGPTAPNYVGQV